MPGVTVRQLARGADDGYRSRLVPGLKSGADAERLAEELAFAAARLEVLATEPPGLYAEVADPAGELEERTWLAFLIAYLGSARRRAAVRRDRARPRPLELGRAAGPRRRPRPAPAGPTRRGSAERTIDAYRAWAARSGSQGAAFTGEPAWTPERRFARAFERLALPGFGRGARV